MRKFRYGKKGGREASFLSLFGVTVLMAVISGLRTVFLGLMTGGAWSIDEAFCMLLGILWNSRRIPQ